MCFKIFAHCTAIVFSVARDLLCFTLYLFCFGLLHVRSFACSLVSLFACLFLRLFACLLVCLLVVCARVCLFLFCVPVFLCHRHSLWIHVQICDAWPRLCPHIPNRITPYLCQIIGQVTAYPTERYLILAMILICVDSLMVKRRPSLQIPQPFSSTCIHWGTTNCACSAICVCTSPFSFVCLSLKIC